MAKLKSNNKKIFKSMKGGAEDFEANYTVDKSSSMTSKIFNGLIMLIIVIIVCVIIYAIYKHFSDKRYNEPILIDQPVDATVSRMIPASSIPSSNSNEFTINFWMFVRDWNYNYEQPKCVLYYGDPDCKQASPLVFLYPNTNNLMIRMAENNPNNNKSMNPFSCNDVDTFDVKKPCDVSNIPLQRWVQISIVLWNTTTDVYVNGKLARSCTSPNVPKMMNGQNIYIGQGGGFNGYISRLKYYNYSVSSRDIYALYRGGPYKKVSWITKMADKIKNFSSTVSSCSNGTTIDYSSSSSSSTIPDPDAFKYGTVVVQGEGEEQDVIIKSSCNAK
jgi:hypothetical protein